MGAALSLFRRTIGYFRPHYDQHRPVLQLGNRKRAVNRVNVIAVINAYHLPSIGGEAASHIFGKGEFGASFNRNFVAVINSYKALKVKRPRKRRSLGGNALHHAAIPHQHISFVIYYRKTVPVETPRKMGPRHRHANRHRKALA